MHASFRDPRFNKTLEKLTVLDWPHKPVSEPDRPLDGPLEPRRLGKGSFPKGSDEGQANKQQRAVSCSLLYKAHLLSPPPCVGSMDSGNVHLRSVYLRGTAFPATSLGTKVRTDIQV